MRAKDDGAMPEAAVHWFRKGLRL
eukprot:COSAG02_NODE_4331_length_5494_cov_21.645478_1_plen_23_part_10